MVGRSAASGRAARWITARVSGIGESGLLLALALDSGLQYDHHPNPHPADAFTEPARRCLGGDRASQGHDHGWSSRSRAASSTFVGDGLPARSYFFLIRSR
jgi:hypothetical protein